MSEMLHYSKRIIVPVLILLIAAAVSGCGGVAGGKINSPVQTDYLVENNIDFDYVTEEFENGSGEYLKISGLKDKETENSINDMIYAKYTELKESRELPPYRGIKQMVGEGEEPQSCYISADRTASVNNILSLCIYKSCFFSRDEGDEFFFSETETLNIDLNTGNEITLEEIFCDDVDYEEFLNRYIEEESFSGADTEQWYFEGESNLKLTAPFKGIRPEQKFYISEYDGNLQLVFDYETPEVYCENYSPVVFTVDMGDNSALSERFYDKGNCIYEDESLNYRILDRPFDTNEAVEVYETIPVGDRGAAADIYAVYYKDMPEPAFKFTESLLKIDEDYLERYRNAVEDTALEYGMDSVPGYASCYINVNRSGNYTNIISECSGGIYLDDIMPYSESLSRYYCFRGGEDEPMKISDVFVKDCDIKESVINAFMNNYRDYTEEGYEDAVEIDEETLRSYFEEVWEKINGFAVRDTCLTLSYDDLRSVTEAYFGGEDLWVYEMFCERAEYKYLGAENLNIFE